MRNSCSTTPPRAALSGAGSYIELPLVKNAETKEFYTQVFGWELRNAGDQVDLDERPFG